MFQLIIKKFFEGYFRHPWLNLLPFVLITLSACLAYVLTKPTYASEGVMFIQKESLLSSLNSVGNSNTNMWSTPAQTTSAELSELLQTDSFIRAVIHSTDLEAKMSGGAKAVDQTIEETRKKVWVTVLGDNQIKVHATFENPKIAAQLANGVIESYIKWQSNSKVAESEAALTFFGNLIQVYQADLGKARDAMKAYLEAHPQPIRGDIPGLEALEIKRLQADIDLATQRYSSALDKEENARLALSQVDSNTRQTYVVLDVPQEALKPVVSLKDMAIKYGMFLVLGALLSVSAVVGGVLLDRTLRFNIEINNSLGLPVLSSVPLVSLDYLKSAAAEPAPAVEAQPAPILMPVELEPAPVKRASSKKKAGRS